MESFDDSNSQEMIEDSSEDIRPNRNSEGCSCLQEETMSGTVKEGKESLSASGPSGTSRKSNIHSLPRIPRVAVQEKIIICIENSQGKGLEYTFSDLEENSKEPNSHAIRNEALRIMMLNKLALAKDTEFAIASVEPGKFKWLLQPTSNLNRLSKSLGENKSVFSNEDISHFDITSIFSSVLKKFDIPENNSVTVIPPSHIIRVIFVYNNSFLVPQVNTKEPSYLKFITSPYCFLDILYLHEKQSDFNNVDKIYQEFGKIGSSSSYLLESSRDVTKVFNNTVKLLAHPNQRVVEAMWSF